MTPRALFHPRRARRLATAFALVAATAAGAATAGAQVDPIASSTESPTLRPGDLIRINVWGDPAMSGEYPISSDGTIQHPIYREIVVTGVPVDALEERVRTLLSRLVATPQFVVQPLVRVAVGGQVRQPNVHLVPANMTISDAIMMSGGVTELGRMEKVRLVRDGRERMLDLTSADMSAVGMRVRSGDQIVVLRQRSVLFDIIMPVSSVIAGLGSIAVLLTRR